jgi:SAM-dependent methyltransferase
VPPAATATTGLCVVADRGWPDDGRPVSVLELLAPTAGGLYLDVGGGTGAAARALGTVGRECAAGEPVAVVLDRSVTMTREARRRGTISVAGAAEALPFADSCFDGAWSDRTFQHLADPGRGLAELLRVTRPGGRIVIVDPDYDTQVVDVADRELARRVLRFRADHLLRSGSIAHRVPGLLAALGADIVRVEAATLVVRDHTAVDNVMGLRTWAATATSAGSSAQGASLAPPVGRRLVVARLEVPVVACLDHQAVGVEPRDRTAGEGGRLASPVHRPSPVLHEGAVALDHRRGEAHVLDAPLVGERLRDVLAHRLAVPKGWPERSGPVHAVLGVEPDDRIHVVCQPSCRPHLRPPLGRPLRVHAIHLSASSTIRQPPAPPPSRLATRRRPAVLLIRRR